MDVTERPALPEVVIILTHQEAQAFVSEGFRSINKNMQPVSYGLYNALMDATGIDPEEGV